MRRQCPPWCVADHDSEDEPGAVRHRSATRDVPVVLEGRGGEHPKSGELLVEVFRLHDEAAVWVYLGDGWTGFALSVESASRLSAALTDALRDASGGSE